MCSVICFQMNGVAIQITDKIELMHRKSLLLDLYCPLKQSLCVFVCRKLSIIPGTKCFN